MNQKKIWISVGVVVSIILTYSVLANYKYATTLMDMFYEETVSLTMIDHQAPLIEDIIEKRVSNEEKNNILEKERVNIGSVGSCFFNLDKYGISNKKVKDMSVDLSGEIIDKIDYISALIDKDINEFNNDDIDFLKDYQKTLDTIRRNSIEISEKRDEVFPIPFYTVSKIENNFYAIFDAVSK